MKKFDVWRIFFGSFIIVTPVIYVRSINQGIPSIEYSIIAGILAGAIVARIAYSYKKIMEK